MDVPVEGGAENRKHTAPESGELSAQKLKSKGRVKRLFEYCLRQGRAGFESFSQGSWVNSCHLCEVKEKRGTDQREERKD